MNEEQAVFIEGKRLSALRNSGEELSSERIIVGNSWVLPDELADEYDRHYPPGPRKHKKVTDKTYQYSLVESKWDCRGEMMGVHISYDNHVIKVLEEALILPCNFRGDLSERIQTSKDNRYDVIEGHFNTFVIDKLEDKISVSRYRFRVDSVTFSEESPIAGNESVYIEDSESLAICRVQFPFLAFDDFWASLNGYVEFRKQQISELRST